MIKSKKQIFILKIFLFVIIVVIDIC